MRMHRLSRILPANALRRASVAALGLALSMALLFSCQSLRVEAVQPQSRFAASGQFFEWQGHRLYYLEQGQASAPAIVLIHGFGSSVYTWRHLIEPLARTHRVLAIDLLGFGFSDKPDAPQLYSIDAFSQQVFALMDQRQVKRAVFAGNSMGGKISLLAAQRAPERVQKLVLIDAAAYPRSESGDGGDRPLILSLAAQPCVGEVLTQFNSRSRVQAMLEDVYHDDSKIVPADVDAYYAPLQMDGGSRAALALLRSQDFGGNIADGIPGIQAPALVLWGATDRWIPLKLGERLAGDLPNAKLTVFPDVGHVPQEEAPELVLQAMRDFLK